MNNEIFSTEALYKMSTLIGDRYNRIYINENVMNKLVNMNYFDGEINSDNNLVGRIAGIDVYKYNNIKEVFELNEKYKHKSILVYEEVI